LYADPNLINEALKTGESLPLLSSEPIVLMFSPGLPGLCYAPAAEEIVVWEALDAPAPAGELGRHASPQTLAQLLKQGIIEYAD
jgi:hypothetical protein